MTQVERKGTGASKAGLVVCIVVIAVLFFSLLLVYSNLESQVNTLRANNNNLQNQVNTLTTQKNSLQTEIDSLKASKLQQVNFDWSDNHPLFGPAYVVVSGIVFNSGTNSANNVVITIRIYGASNNQLGSGTISLGTVSGKSYENFTQGFNYGGDAYYVLWDLTST